jgi:hypothetical protein
MMRLLLAAVVLAATAAGTAAPATASPPDAYASKSVNVFLTNTTCGLPEGPVRDDDDNLREGIRYNACIDTLLSASVSTFGGPTYNQVCLSRFRYVPDENEITGWVPLDEEGGCREDLASSPFEVVRGIATVAPVQLRLGYVCYEVCRTDAPDRIVTLSARAVTTGPTQRQSGPHRHHGSYGCLIWGSSNYFSTPLSGTMTVDESRLVAKGYSDRGRVRSMSRGYCDEE